VLLAGAKKQTLINAYVDYASAFKIVIVISKHCRYIMIFLNSRLSKFFSLFFFFFNLDDELLIDSMERFVILLSRRIVHGE